MIKRNFIEMCTDYYKAIYYFKFVSATVCILHNFDLEIFGFTVGF